MDRKMLRSSKLRSKGPGFPSLLHSPNILHPSAASSYSRGFSEEVPSRQLSTKSFRKRLEELSMGTLESLLGDVLANQSYLHKLQEIQNLGKLLDSIDSTIYYTDKTQFLHRDVAAGIVQEIVGSNVMVPKLQTLSRSRDKSMKVSSKRRNRKATSQLLSKAELKTAANSLEQTIAAVGRAWGTSRLIPSGAMSARAFRNSSKECFLKLDGKLDASVSEKSSCRSVPSRVMSASAMSSQQSFSLNRNNKPSKLKKAKLFTTTEKRITSAKHQAPKKLPRNSLKHTFSGNSSVDESCFSDMASVVSSGTDNFSLTRFKNEMLSPGTISPLIPLLGERIRSMYGSTQTSADAATGLDFTKQFQDAGVDPPGMLKENSPDSAVADTESTTPECHFGTAKSHKSFSTESWEGQANGNLAGNNSLDSSSAIMVPVSIQVTSSDLKNTDSRQLTDVSTDECIISVESYLSRESQSRRRNQASRDSLSATSNELGLHYGTTSILLEQSPRGKKKSQSSESFRTKIAEHHSKRAVSKPATSDMLKGIAYASADPGKMCPDLISRSKRLKFPNEEMLLAHSLEEAANAEKEKLDTNCSGDENLIHEAAFTEEKNSHISTETTIANSVNNSRPSDSECSSILHYTLKEYGIDNADTELYETIDINNMLDARTRFLGQNYMTEEKLLDQTFRVSNLLAPPHSSVHDESNVEFDFEYDCARNHPRRLSQQSPAENNFESSQSTLSMTPDEQTESDYSVADEMVDDVLQNLSYHEFWLHC